MLAAVAGHQYVDRGLHRPVGATLFLSPTEVNRPDGPSFKPTSVSLSSVSPVDAHTQAVLFNAVPLLVLAALYLAVAFALAPVLWRERRSLREVGSATALLFPCLGLTTAILGVEVLVER